ncbi:MAG: purine-nucleoside phosphorylase [Lachnospiraceae bacterium]|nr:purine-nucleoside phosphorylase [Lachnospiraceae bacterium]
MNTVYEKVIHCYNDIREKTDFVPKVGVVLGSGLGDFANQLCDAVTLDYKEIDGFPVSTVPGHKGRFVFGYVGKTPVMVMQGRVHYYEGYDISDVVLPIRLMKLMGAETVFLTNAAGGLNLNFSPGDFMMITDQIASFVPSPLIGENISEWGLRFPPMQEIYEKDLQEIIETVAKEEKIKLQKGVYVQLSGPNYESPSEVKMCQILGGDAVGMSTAVEAIAAKHIGLKVCGISCISNMGCGISKTPLNHEEVGEMAAKVAPLFQTLLYKSIERM